MRITNLTTGVIVDFYVPMFGSSGMASYSAVPGWTYQFHFDGTVYRVVDGRHIFFSNEKGGHYWTVPH